ncbi:unnamed protein product [Phytophthora fragariaefolia]|uniref:Unnamed protein product n=1 Tax=Phytophthora fragariaefolia TaxID=1490495 RepID=A0A9W6YMA0_9STRA|nr:unnamed protein product [Phytophthora fragariaefolia]
MDGLMKVLGILFFMTRVNMQITGPAAGIPNVWRENGFDGIISSNRFKLLRRCISFRATPTTLAKDAAARISASAEPAEANWRDTEDRLNGVIVTEEIQQQSNELDLVPKARQHVLEVVQPMFGTNRIVNMDSYYASVLQAVSINHNMVAASWCDGSIVHMVTNADASTALTVASNVGNQGVSCPYVHQGVPNQARS